MENVHSFTNNQLSYNNQGFNHAQGFMPLNSQVLPTVQPLTFGRYQRTGNLYGKKSDFHYQRNYHRLTGLNKNRNTPERKEKLHQNYLDRKIKKEAEAWFRGFENSLNRPAKRFYRKKKTQQDQLYEALRKVREQELKDTFQSRGSCVIPLMPHWKADKFGAKGKTPISSKSYEEPFYENNSNRKKVDDILKSGLNYGIWCGKEKFFEDYRLVVIDFDCGGFTKVAFRNNLSYVVTGRGIHIYCLVKKETWKKSASMLGIEGKDGLVTRVADLKCGGLKEEKHRKHKGDTYKKNYVVGVGSTHHSGKKYELRNFWNTPGNKKEFYYRCETIDDIYKLLGEYGIREISRKEINESRKKRCEEAIRILGIKKSREIFEDCLAKGIFSEEKGSKNSDQCTKFKQALIKAEGIEKEKIQQQTTQIEVLPKK